MTERPDWMRPADVDILVALQRTQPEYLPLVANRVGMHLPYVERRCGVLTEQGCIEPVTGEVVYRLTDRGEALLETDSVR